MTPEKAIKLIQKAVDFYISQNYEVAANCYQIGYDREGYCKEAFKNRADMRAAMEMAKKEMLK